MALIGGSGRISGEIYRDFFDGINGINRINDGRIAIIALTRKLLCIMRAMLMTGELFNEKLVQEVLKAA